LRDVPPLVETLARMAAGSAPAAMPDAAAPERRRPDVRCTAQARHRSAELLDAAERDRAVAVAVAVYRGAATETTNWEDGDAGIQAS
jgi:hypothetical protein